MGMAYKQTDKQTDRLKNITIMNEEENEEDLSMIVL